jgi:hypothetical protein
MRGAFVLLLFEGVLMREAITTHCLGFNGHPSKRKRPMQVCPNGAADQLNY